MSAERQTPDLWEITEYLAGHATPERVRLIEQWRDASLEQRQEFEVLARAWQATAPQDVFPGMSGERAAWRAMAQQIPVLGRDVIEERYNAVRLPLRSELGIQPRERGRFKAQPLRQRIWSAAAIALGIVGLVVSWNVGAHHIGQQGVPSMMTYSTGNGERATIALPDGGTVALNVASRLEVPMDYMAGHRTVHLTGEGLFTVSHHDGTALTVVAGGTTARVLGTSFVIRHYAADTSTIVAVRDGKVAVGTTAVTANQLVEIGRSGVPSVRSSDATPFTFAAGTLTINGLSLVAAIVELDRWYDADIRLGDPALARRHMKGTFGAGSLGELAERLTLIYDVRVVRDGRVLTLYPRH